MLNLAAKRSPSACRKMMTVELVSGVESLGDGD